MQGHKTSHLPIRYFLALLWAHPILHVSVIRVNICFPLTSDIQPSVARMKHKGHAFVLNPQWLSFQDAKLPLGKTDVEVWWCAHSDVASPGTRPDVCGWWRHVQGKGQKVVLHSPAAGGSPETSGRGPAVFRAADSLPDRWARQTLRQSTSLNFFRF